MADTAEVKVDDSVRESAVETAGGDGTEGETAGRDCTAVKPRSAIARERTAEGPTKPKQPNPRIPTWPTRLLKSKLAQRIRKPATAQGGGDRKQVPCVAADSNAPGEVTERDILSTLPKNFYVQLESKKWSERKEVLENLEKTLNETPKIASGDYTNLIIGLKDVILDDSNVMVVCIAIKCVSGLAKQLKKKFQPYAVGTMRTLLVKFKEKKANVVTALREATDHVYATTTLQQLQQEILNNLDSSYPSIKSETALFLVRVFTIATPAILNKKFLKAIVPVLVKSLADQDVTVKASAAQALAMAMKVVGEACIVSFFEDEVGDRKMAQIKEYCGNAVHLKKGAKPVDPARSKDKALENTPAEPRDGSHKGNEDQPKPKEVQQMVVLKRSEDVAGLIEKAKAYPQDDPNQTQTLEIDNPTGWNDFPEYLMQDSNAASKEPTEEAPEAVFLNKLSVLSLLGTAEGSRSHEEIAKISSALLDCTNKMGNAGSKTRHLGSNPIKTKDNTVQAMPTQAQMKSFLIPCREDISKATEYTRFLLLDDPYPTRRLETDVPAGWNEFSNYDRECIDTISDEPTNESPETVLSFELSILSFLKGMEESRSGEGTSKFYSDLFDCTHKMDNAEPRKAVLGSAQVRPKGPPSEPHKAPIDNVVQSKPKEAQKIVIPKPSEENVSSRIEKAKVFLPYHSDATQRLETDNHEAQDQFSEYGTQDPDTASGDEPTKEASAESFAKLLEPTAESRSQEENAESSYNLFSCTSKMEAKYEEPEENGPRMDIGPLITEQIKNELTYKNWHARRGAVFKLQEIISANPHITGNLSDSPLLIAGCLKDIDSEVSYAAIVMVENLFKAMGPEGKKHVKVFLPPLLKSIGHPKAWIRNAVRSCLDTTQEIFGEDEFFENKMIADALNSGSPTTQAELWDWLKDKLPRITTIPKDELNSCLPVLFDNLTNGNHAVRKSAAECVHGFMIHLGTWAVYTASEEHVNESNVDVIESILDGARRKLPDISDVTLKERIKSRIPVRKTSRIKNTRRITFRSHQAAEEQPQDTNEATPPPAPLATPPERAQSSPQTRDPSPPPPRPWWRVYLPLINYIF